MEQLAESFSNQQAAKNYFAQLQKAKPRYIRDQLLLIKKAIDKSKLIDVDQTLEFCQVNRIFNANDFKAVLDKISQEPPVVIPPLEELLIKSVDRKHFSVQPQTSSITDYESIVNPE